MTPDRTKLGSRARTRYPRGEMRLRRARGFSLIEMMMSVGILAIIASVAIPQFIRYQLKVKTAEARQMIGGIIHTQESFAAEYENYANIATPNPTGAPGIVKRSWQVVECPGQCSRTNPTACTSFECIGFQPPSQVFYSYASVHRLAGPGRPPEYAVGASADLDGDSNIGSYAYRSSNYGGPVGVLADGTSTCPANIPSVIVENCSVVSF